MQRCHHKNPSKPAKSRSHLHNLFSKILLYLLITLQLNTWLPYFEKWLQGWYLTALVSPAIKLHQKYKKINCIEW
jgi:hypothetical protein